MRQKSDEVKHSPRVYLLWSDGTVSSKKLDCSADVYLEAERAVKKATEVLDVAELLDVIGTLKTLKLDFKSVVKDIMERMEVVKEVRERVLESTGAEE